MQATFIRRTAAGAVIAAVAAAAGVVSSTASAKPHAAAAADTAIIKMNYSKKKHSYFTGPKTVKQGAELEILNTTSPQSEGPHTFSLDDSPLDKAAQKDCEHNKSDLCNAVIKAQKVEFKSKNDIIVHKKNVDNGKKGWDTEFTSDGKTAGDTWYTDTQGQTQTRKVTAPVGTTLHYFCAVHPFMQGTIKVVK